MNRRHGQSLLTKTLILAAVCYLAGCSSDPQSVGMGGSIPGDRNILVVNGLGETLTAIDLGDMTVYNDLMTLGKWPNHVTSDESMQNVYVVNSGDNQVMEIDAFTGEVTRRLDVGIGQNPWRCEITGSSLWVTNFLTGEVDVIDLNTGTVSARINIGGTPQAIHIFEDVVYVTDTAFQYSFFGQGRVVAIDADSRAVLGSCSVGTNPQDLLVDSSGRLHVVCTGSYSPGGGDDQGEIHVVDSNGLVPVDTLEMGGNPSSLCMGSGGLIYTAGYWGGLMAYNANSLEVLHGLSSPLLAEDGIMDIEFDPSSGLLYITDFDEDRIMVFDPSSEQVVSRLGVGDGPVRIHIFEPVAAKGAVRATGQNGQARTYQARTDQVKTN